MKKKNLSRKNILTVIISVSVAAVLLVGLLVWNELAGRIDVSLDLVGAQKLVDDTFAALPVNVSGGSKELLKNTQIKVKDVTYGNEKNIILDCEYSTLDVKAVYNANSAELFGLAYSLYLEDPKANAVNYKHKVTPLFLEYLDGAQKLQGEIEITVYATGKDKLTVYLNDETVNTCLGGILDVRRAIKETNKILTESGEIDISRINTLRNGIGDVVGLNNYSSQKPDTGTPLEKLWNSFSDEFYRNFIEADRWTYLVKGLGNTIAITLLAVLLGVVIGFVVAIIRVTNQKTGKLNIADKICRLYLAVVRGTPVMVQLIIIYFVILLPIGVEKFTSAVLCFGFNSGAYVAEIVRGGIMSIDEGQSEAGRSLGFSYGQTMLYIVFPQAFKAILPSLANEFITLLKESSVAFYIGVADLTQGGLKIRSVTYSNFMPLIAVALIYLVVVLVLSHLVSKLEKRLRKGDR